MDSMEISSSSESEILESTTKINLPSSKRRKVAADCSRNCIICSQPKDLIRSSQTSFVTFKKSVQIRISVDNDNENLKTMMTVVNSSDENQLIWHRKCYSTFTSNKNIATFKNKFKKNGCRSEDTASRNSYTLRKDKFDITKCLFCQKRSNQKKLSQILSQNIEAKIKIISKNDPVTLTRIGENDLIAAEMKYHSSCFVKKWKLHEQNEKSQCQIETESRCMLPKLIAELDSGLAKGKVFSLNAVYDRYIEICGEVENQIGCRTLLKKLKHHYGDQIECVRPRKRNESMLIVPMLTKSECLQQIVEEKTTSTTTDDFLRIGQSEFADIVNLCHTIRQEMKEFKGLENYKDLSNASFRDSVPARLFFIVQLLITDNEECDKTQIVLNICQDIIYSFSNFKKHTPKHAALGLILHQETKSKKIIETLHACGHSLPYRDVIRIRNSIAQSEIDRFYRNEKVVVPSQLVSGRFVQFAGDNIDILEETLDKGPTFHATQLAAFQRGPNKNVSEDLKLVPFNFNIKVPEEFHALVKCNIKKNTPVDGHPSQEIIDNIDSMNCDFMRAHNLAWMFCRLNSNENVNTDSVVPQWTGFNKIVSRDNSELTCYGYLPILPHVASEYDTVWTLMLRCKQIAEKLENSFTVISFDQAIYYKAKEIQWHQPEQCTSFVIRLGGFHIMMNFLRCIGQHMENSGLADVWIESGLYGDCTVSAIMSGKKWNKAIRAHKLTYEALLRMLLPIFENWLIEGRSDVIHSINLTKLLAAEVTNSLIKGKSDLSTFTNMVDTCKEFSETFREFIACQNATTQYWFSYIEMVEILLSFLYSERTANWNLHISSFSRMIPWFFTYNHTNYSKWGSVYLLDMLDLPNKAPVVQDEFKKGNFVIKRLTGGFNQISVDQALEHINKRSKDAGGIVGITKNSNRLDEWFLSYNTIGVLIDDFRAENGCNTSKYTQNIESGKKRIKIDEESVMNIQVELERFRVFNRVEEKLMCISRNEIASREVEDFLLTAYEKGKGSFNSFVANFPRDFYKPFKKHIVLTFKTSSTTKVVERTNHTWSNGQNILQRVLAVKEMGREIDFCNVFKYELTQFPMALAPNGSLNLPTNKSILGNIIQGYTTVSETLPNDDVKTCHIFDGMAIVQCIGKPTNAKTFGELADIFCRIVLKNEYNAQRIDVVFDNYKEQSIKNFARLKRGKRVASIQKVIDRREITLPQQWHNFIHSPFNKSQLTNFLSNEVHSFSQAMNVNVITSGGFNNIMDFQSNYVLSNTEILHSNHEEADTRILLHILSAKQEGYKRCIVECKDTDVLVLLLHFKEYLTDEIWMKTGNKNNPKFINIHGINMDLQLRNNLLALHALTGCDTTSQFSGIGKKTAWKTYITHSDLLDNFGHASITDENMKQVETFVIRLYSNNKEITCIDHLRSIMAASKPLHKLPPTKDSLKQHLLRVWYQTHIWRNSLTSVIEFGNVLEYGWKINVSDQTIEPVLQLQPSLPHDLKFLTNCKCQKDCSSRSCSCRKNNLPCTGACKCMAYCVNSITQKSNNDASSDEDDG